MTSDDDNAVSGHRPPLQGQSRLQRLERVFIDHPLYFVTTCTDRRRPLLANEAVHDAFITFARRGQDYGAVVGRYVLMPDHLHFFVAINPRRDLTLSDWIKSLKNTLSKVLRSSGHPAPHWQKSFFDHLLRSGESYGEKWAYVHQNPERARLVKCPGEWPFQGEIFDLPFD